MLDRRQLIQAMVASGAAIGASAPLSAATRAQSGPPSPWEEEGFVERGGGRVHWVSMGKGPVVVMMAKLGGWVGDWRHVAPLVAKNYRVIAIDAPGHGGSRMATPPPYVHTLSESAAMVRAALEELGVERYAFVGNSLGGCIGLTMAALWPGDMTHMIALSSALPAGVPRSALPKLDGEVPAGQYDARWTPQPRPFEEMNKRFNLTREIHDEMNASRAAAGRWVRPSERGVFVANIPAYLPRIAARTLLIYGSTGPYRRYRETGLSLIPHVQAATVADGGSFVHQEKPVETAEVILRFLAS